MTISYTGGLNFTGPSKGDTDYDTTVDALYTKASAHDHTAGGKGVQIATAAIATDAVTDTKIRLANNAAMRGRNAAGSADVDLIKVSTGNLAALPTAVVFTSTETLTTTTAVMTPAKTMCIIDTGCTAATLAAGVDGQMKFIHNKSASSCTITLTGRPGASDVLTVPAGASALLFAANSLWQPFAGLVAVAPTIA